MTEGVNVPKNREKNLKFLFVCYANICRSPMAEGIARTFDSEGIMAESAGIAAVKNGPAPQAVEAMKLMYGIDISGHKARNVTEVDLDFFNFIVALDSMVYRHLKSLNRIAEEKLFEWDIHDPVGQPVSVFQKVAERIRKRIEQFLINREIQ